MGLMHAERRAPATPSGADAVPITHLLELRERIEGEVGRCKVEVLDGRIIVSPMPVLWHARVCQWLYEALRDISRQNGWFTDVGAELELPPARDRIEPDLVILRDAGQLPNLESLRPLSHVLLVVEVISPSSIREDREDKPRSCARAGIPLYLLIDRLVAPMTVTLLREPGKDGYVKRDAVEFGGKLNIPDPFALTLDTSTLPLPR
jgi:Uma2 family endonuclease